MAFYNRLLSMDNERLSKRMFLWLGSPEATLGRGAQANWVKSVAPSIFKKYKTEIPKEGTAKK